MTNDTINNLRQMIFHVCTGDHDKARKHLGTVVKEKIQSRYTEIARNVAKQKDK